MHRKLHPACLILPCLTLGGCLSDPGDTAHATRPLTVPTESRTATSPLAAADPIQGGFIHTGPGKPAMLPAFMTKWEEDLERQMAKQGRSGFALADKYSDYRDKNITNFHITKAPATKSFRTPAEYEASQAYLLNWRAGYTSSKWTDLFEEIIQGAWGEVPVILMTSSTTHQTWIESRLTNLGFTAAEQAKNIIWWKAKSDAIWARDFGPVSIVETGSTGKEKLSFIDYKYYSTRVLDDEVPALLAKEWGVNDYRPDLSFEGGNFQTTSDGLCSSTKGTLYYNPQLSQSAVEDILATYQGCKKTIFPQPMTGGVIAHIDMFSKFGADDHMMVGSYTDTQHKANKAILDANTKLFEATKTPTGKTIKVTRIPMPDIGGSGYGTIWRTYTNSLALTDDGKPGVVLIPTYDDETSNLTAAMAAYKAVFPGWKLVQIDSKIIIPGQGAIHCITMQIPVGVRASMETPPGNLCGPKSYSCHKRICGTIPAEGCCNGTLLKYCSKGSLKLKDCYSKPSCGWDSANALYDCSMLGTADPAAKFPMTCPLASTDAAPAFDMGPDLTPDLPIPDLTPDQPVPDLEPPDSAAPDASLPDGGGDDDGDQEGCSCLAGGGEIPEGVSLLMLLGLTALWTRRRTGPGRGPHL